ncbi:dTDP-4-dehydrorhamnose 3,5-epimerase [Vineibacter terrae]|uniref:dTDP-4-dehydrorhamnose 3,5-epimerase n=1 Tax=Vineibacter terrae TaxID=2586908 RepID=UPI002E346EA4|nr:dTDP-4-dehydrorhamnose 3,5-epimerase [Vineibacter terrae]HEX2886742.1 dTDP-4-dehydrorhamnose 3,5-epimerase [Vineibacter terrae]
MIFHETALSGAYVVELERYSDERGHFARSFCREEFARQGLPGDLVQGNVSVNPTRGTLRGMHYQVAPHEEIKLLRCVRGAIYDVIVDVRQGSPTFGKWIGVELTPASFRMLYAPAGFAHGFQTLLDDTEVNYLVSAPYTPAAARGLRHDDPRLAITWPLPVTRISRQDASWPLMEAADC